MIVTCKECSTKFNFDDSLVKENGSKARCSICRNIFTVYPIHNEPETAPETEPEIVPAFMSESCSIADDDTIEPKTDEPKTDEKKNSFVDDIKTQVSDLRTDDSEFTQKESNQDNNEDNSDRLKSHSDTFAFEEPKQKSFGQDFPQDSSPKQEWFDMVLDSSKNSASSQINEWTKQDEEEIFLKEDLFVNGQNKTLAEEQIFLKEELTLEEEEKMLKQYHAKRAKLFGSESEFKSGDSGADEKDFYESSQDNKPDSKRSIFSILLLIIILIFFLTAGTYIASILTGYKIPYLSEINIPIVREYIEKIIPKGIEAKPVLNDKIISARFIANTTAGTLFIVTGQVDNTTEETFNYIELEAILTTGEKEKSINKKVFCGNVVSDEMLKNGDILEIEQALYIKEGKNNSNINIKPGSSVPFMVVFSKLPDELKNYYIKVINFEKAKAN